MKIAALILGLLGSFILFIVGVLWTDNAEHLKDVEQAMKVYAAVTKEASAATGKPFGQDEERRQLMLQADAVRGKAKASYPMVVAGLLAFIAAFFVVKFPKVSGAVMAAAVVIPAVFYWGTLLVGFVLALAALLAFLVRSKPQPSAA
ncbi:MAG TPA: hypothetical protein VGV61_14700 [Thermoanaerobaculia bacterium]|jgi:hypothetical protein|nr:hypothetical protein [Thermoanaerobaculia bacterium]